MCQVKLVNDFDTNVVMMWDTGRADWWGQPGVYPINTHPVLKTKLCYYHTKKLEGHFGGTDNQSRIYPKDRDVELRWKRYIGLV